jgi:hypothetical protein
MSVDAAAVAAVAVTAEAAAEDDEEEEDGMDSLGFLGGRPRPRLMGWVGMLLVVAVTSDIGAVMDAAAAAAAVMGELAVSGKCLRISDSSNCCNCSDKRVQRGFTGLLGERSV